MTPLLRLTSATVGRPPVVVYVAPHELKDAEAFRDRIAASDLGRSGRRTVEIVDTAGGAR